MTQEQVIPLSIAQAAGYEKALQQAAPFLDLPLSKTSLSIFFDGTQVSGALKNSDSSEQTAETGDLAAIEQKNTLTPETPETKKNKRGFLPNIAIIVSPHQQEYLPPFWEWNSLAPAMVRHPFAQNQDLMDLLLEHGPVIASLHFQDAKGKKNESLTAYLESLVKNEFSDQCRSSNKETPQETQQKKEPELRPYPIGQPRLENPIFPAISYSSTVDLLEELLAINEEKRKIKDKPFEYLQNTLYLNSLHDRIIELEHRLGQSIKSFSEVSISNVTPTHALPTQKYAVVFRIADERIYVVGNESKTTIIGLYSSEEKKNRYGCYPIIAIHVRSKEHKKENSKEDERESPRERERRYFNEDDSQMEGIFSNLLSTGHLEINAEYGASQVKKMEYRALRKRGFQLLHNPSHDALGRKMISLQMSIIDRYTHLSNLIAENQLTGLDFETWKIINDVCRGQKSISALPPSQRMYFMQPRENDPVIQNLFEQLRPSAQGNSLTEDIRAQDIKEADIYTQKALIAEYLCDGNRIDQERIPKCTALLGEKYKPLIKEVVTALAPDQIMTDISRL